MFKELFETLWMFSRKSLSDLEKTAVFSMARLGNLSNLKCGKNNPFYRGDVKHGEVLVPHEFSELHKIIGGSVDVWFSNDISKGMKGEEAFRLQIIIGDVVSSVWVLYGVSSGIISLEFDGFMRFICNVPVGYKLSDLVKLLTSGEEGMKNFVLENGRLNKAQLDMVRRKGLDGLG